MKIMTINTHSLIEPDYERKLRQLSEVILKERPNILAMQEVNQTAGEKLMARVELPGYVDCQKQPTPIRQDNHAARLAQILFLEKLPYYWTWLPMKLGYEKYDEGLAIFSRRPITGTDVYRISRSDSYQYWKTRWMLGIQTDEPERGWFYTVHMGWWKDEEEPFGDQWVRLEEHLRSTKATDGQVWLMGDFNSRDDVREEGYDLIRRAGWQDSWLAAEKKDDGITAGTGIDGWKDQEDPKTDLGAGSEADSETDPGAGSEADPKTNPGAGSENDPGMCGDSGKNQRRPGMRIDYIWSSRPVEIESSWVVCDGTNYPVVSDHYGVLIQTKKP